jgi:phytoene synthase
MAVVRMIPRISDAEHCARLTRARARAFSLAATFLPDVKRRAVFALYAFCRRADDIVDLHASRNRAGQSHGADSLARYRAALESALAGAPEGPVFRELAWALSQFEIPRAPLFAIIDGVARDLEPVEYSTWDSLADYCHAVASTVGELCTAVCGAALTDRARLDAVRYARTLGVAMQLTNILRDVGEDARLGRCYLPTEDLRAYGLQRDDVLHDTGVASRPGWRSLMTFEITRARALYADAGPGIEMLDEDSRACVRMCADGYAAILHAIEQQAYDTIGSRAVVRPWRRMAVAWNAWRGA